MTYHITEIIKTNKIEGDDRLYWGSINHDGSFEEACNIFFNGYEEDKNLIEGK